MTTKPKAKKFRIRRSPTAGDSEMAHNNAAPVRAAGGSAQSTIISQGASARSPAPSPAAGATSGTGAAGAQPNMGAAQATPRSATPSASQSAPATSAPQRIGVDEQIDAIRREGLTGRQLRMARRVAQKHNLPATSDFDAVRLLRDNGIDPFQKSNMLELVVPPGGADSYEGAPDAFENLPATTSGNGKVQLPQTIPVAKQTLPSTDVSPAQRREREIGEIQRDIMRRRRRKMALLGTRLAFFVLLPTIIVGWYFYNMATPMYSTKSEFLILKADNGGGAGIGGLLSGTQFATSQDSIAVQSYLTSKDAMLRLDEDEGFKAHFTQDWIDPIQRLPPDPSNEEAYSTYTKNVKLGYDPTEGVIRMEVIAADPVVSANFSNSLISYAEDRVNHLSEQKRVDQMKDALEGFELAEGERHTAQTALVELQQQGAILDPEGVITTLRSQINNIEIQLQEKQLELAALQDNLRPNKAKVAGAEGDIQRFEALLGQLNERMVDASKGENSLAQLTVRIQMAQADLATRDMMLQSALQQVEQTRMEANRQVRYLTTSVEPVASQDPSYPRKFENTVLAFLVFSGIYLMISLTASILREQVTS